MNYQRIYNQIIEKAITENRKKGTGVYYERHHIIPKCIGGNNDKDNLVLLTAREHYLVHKLLVEIYPDDDLLFYAFWAMCNKQGSAIINRDYKVSSIEYERVKLVFIEKMRNREFSEDHKRKIGKASKGRTHTDASKQKNRESHLGKPSPMTGKTHTADARQKNREAHLGKPSGFKGKTHTAETKEKMRKAKQKIKYEI
jgi:hypothetical protein